MEVTRRLDQGVRVIRIRGRLDLERLKEFRAVLTECREAREKRIVLNLRGVAVLSSSVVGALMSFTNEVKQEEGIVALAENSLEVTHVLDLLRLTDYFPAFDSEEAAVAALRVG